MQVAFFLKPSLAAEKRLAGYWLKERLSYSISGCRSGSLNMTERAGGADAVKGLRGRRMTKPFTNKFTHRIISWPILRPRSQSCTDLASLVTNGSAVTNTFPGQSP